MYGCLDSEVIPLHRGVFGEPYNKIADHIFCLFKLTLLCKVKSLRYLDSHPQAQF